MTKEQYAKLAEDFVQYLSVLDKQYLKDLLAKDKRDFFEERVLIIELPRSIRNVLHLWDTDDEEHPEDISAKVAEIVKQKIYVDENE